MAAKKTGNNKNEEAVQKVLDPFATVAEVGAAGATEKKNTKPAQPKRVVAKVAVKTAAEPAKAVTSKRVSKKSASPTPAIDAFAEHASEASSADRVTLEISETVSKPAKRSARSTKPDTEVKKKKTPAVNAKSRSRTQAKMPAQNTPVETVSSPAVVIEPEIATNAIADIAAAKPQVELSPVFKTLAEPQLPQLLPDNRARLQMQSPTRLYLYWSLRSDPWQQLRAIFGPDLGSYTLVVKLRNLTAGTEQIQRIEAEGEWWFNDVEPGSKYDAEIGFYAVNRPYFRVIFSNSVTTPRRSPSPHSAAEARWTVSATKFADVLDASGFSRDAVDVAIAGDDHQDAEHRTRMAFSEVMGDAEYSTRDIPAEDLRYALLALAGGAPLSALRERVSSSLYVTLQSKKDLSAADARMALASHFEIDATEWTEHEFGPAVFGSSLLNFPKTLTPRKNVTYSPRYNPVSSFALGR